MVAKKGFQAVVLDELTDEQLEEMVLSNWHKLNIALKAGQSEKVLKRLLVCELKRGPNARPNIAERVRSALCRAATKRSKYALENVIAIMCNGSWEELEEQLADLGIESIDCADILYKVAS